MQTHTALQFQAITKLGRKVFEKDNEKFYRIRELANKPPPLTANEVKVLEHFVHSSLYTLGNTLYYEDKIMYPVRHGVRTFKISVKPQPDTKTR